MFKIILTGVIIYWLYKTVGKFFFNTLTNKQADNQSANQRGDTRKGNIHVDSAPKNRPPKDFKGGEYVDYEEVE